MLPTTEYKIGDIIINGLGAVDLCRVIGTAKYILMQNVDMIEEGISPRLKSNGYLS